MRKTLCRIAYRLGLNTLAHALSPSVYYWLVHDEIQRDLQRALDRSEMSIRDWRR